MGWIRNFFKSKPKAQTSGIATPEKWLVEGWGGGYATAAGTYVSEDAALRYTDVLACVTLISKVRASLKPMVYKAKPDGKGKDYVPSHYLNNILQLQPNDEMIGFSFRESEMSNLLMWGNAYSEISRNRITGRVLGLYPAPPDKMRMIRRNDKSVRMIGEDYEYRGGGIRYEWSDDDGEAVSRDSKDMLHIAGYGGNGLIGKSIIGLARELIGLGLAVEEFGARYFGSGTHPAAVVEHPSTVSDKAWDRLKLSLNERYAGLGNSHKLLILEDGMKFNSIGIPPDDAQFIQTRQLNREQVCSLFGVPPHMIAAMERATFNNIEVMDNSFITRGIVPWLERIEDYYTVNLLTESERRQGYTIEHDTANLLRGDFKTRTEGYASGIVSGWLSRNEARIREGLNWVDGLDEFLVPVNMMASDDVGKPGANAAINAVKAALEALQNAQT